MTEYTTKDSGARAHFESGMQRDTEEGKARFDLLRPLDVPYSEQFLTRCAELMGRGAVKYDARNWEKADSEDELARFKSSATRHFEQWFNGETDEDHAAAVFFNLLAHESTAYKIARAAASFDRNGYAIRQRRDYYDPPVTPPEPFVTWGAPQTVTLEAKDIDGAAIRVALGLPPEDEALPHFFDVDGDVWQQLGADHWLVTGPNGHCEHRGVGLTFLAETFGIDPGEPTWEEKARANGWGDVLDAETRAKVASKVAKATEPLKVVDVTLIQRSINESLQRLMTQAQAAAAGYRDGGPVATEAVHQAINRRD